MTESCRSCFGPLTEVLDLGEQRLSDFPRPQDVTSDKAWPLTLVLCEDCGLLQLDTTTPRKLMYHSRYGFRSGTNEAIRSDLAHVVKYALDVKPVNEVHRWLDIACNDGTLLSNVPTWIFRTGVDPVPEIAQTARRLGLADRVIYDYFSSRFFAPKEFDVITSVSMFYDLDDPNKFVHEVKDVLADDGIWVIQQNYAGDMIRQNAVDNVCHEHVTYFALRPLGLLLDSHGLEINDVTFSPVNGGCIRTLVSRMGTRPVSASVQVAAQYEARMALGSPETWRTWGDEVRQELDLTYDYLVRARMRGERVYLYGASTRGGTFLQMIGAGPHLLPYAVERNKDKVGKVMSSTDIPIISEADMRNNPPDALLVSPWFFRDVFLSRERPYLDAGGLMVFPLPHFEIVGKDIL
jgi:NDP-4-keto-2,6-dideoxyhexose 3-C-methyltransferase